MRSGAGPKVKVPKLAEDVSGDWGAHLQCAGLGQGVWHDRLSDVDGSAHNLVVCAEPIPGAAHAVSWLAAWRGILLIFHSTLYAPAVEGRLPVMPAAVFYERDGAGTERDLCWFGDESFLPHLLRVLNVDKFTAVVRFGTAERYPDRQTAAWRSHDAVVAMRAAKLPSGRIAIGRVPN
jgi:hypothetical protein